MESWLFLSAILVVSLLGKNQSLIIATMVVMLIKLLPISSKLFQLIAAKGINWGVTVISVAILVPIATGKIGFSDLLNAFKNPIGWVGLLCGVLVAMLAARGVELIADSPELTVALTIGTIIGVVFFKGVAAGPIIAAGIGYFIMQIIQFVVQR